jgi:hypothetical protein
MNELININEKSEVPAIVEKVKVRKKLFKEYYEDPEYKKRHLAYISEKVKCPVCNISIARCNMSKHKRTKKHMKHEQQEKTKDGDVDKDDMIRKALILALASIIGPNTKKL